MVPSRWLRRAHYRTANRQAREPGVITSYSIHYTKLYEGGKPFDPTLPTVVFLHGALNDHTVWTLLARWFAHHGRGVLAVDLPGHMRSAGPALASIAVLAGSYNFV